MKGHSTFVKALPQILSRHPHAQVVIAGDGPLRDELQEQAGALGVAEAVHLLGVRDDVPELLQRLDLFVLPSNSEGLSNALLEAMANRLAVVATSVGGNPEVVDHGVTGLLVPPRDPEAMADACSDLLDNPERLEDMGRRGEERVEEKFTVQRMAVEMGAFYKELVRGPIPVPPGRREVGRG